MSTTTLYGDSQLASALALVGGTALGELRNDLLKQAIVAAANRSSSPGGSGDVVGPASSTDGAVALWNGATGKLLKDSTAFITGSGTLDFGVGPFTLTVPATGTAALLGVANIFTVNGAASTPACTLSGTPYAGTGTTSFPLLYLNQSAATASTTLNTAGTFFGINSHGTQDLVNWMVDGVTRAKVDYTGVATFGSSAIAGGGLVLNLTSTYGTFQASVIGGGALSTANNISTTGYIYSTSFRFSASDTFINRKAAAAVQLGDDAAGVTNQFFTAASRITSDGVGADLTIAGGNGRGAAGGSLILSYYTTAGAATAGTLTEAMRITTTGAIILAALPTSDPGVPGQLYKSAGVVMQSA